MIKIQLEDWYKGKVKYCWVPVAYDLSDKGTIKISRGNVEVGDNGYYMINFMDKDGALTKYTTHKTYPVYIVEMKDAGSVIGSQITEKKRKSSALNGKKGGRPRKILCDSCRKRVATIFNTGDPYISELYPEEENECQNWCEKCFDDRRGDI